jgi:hypothetical protein
MIKIELNKTEYMLLADKLEKLADEAFTRADRKDKDNYYTSYWRQRGKMWDASLAKVEAAIKKEKG